MKTTIPDSTTRVPRLRAKAGLITVLTAFATVLPLAQGAPPGHNVSAGNVTVIQNDAGNTTNSVTTLLSLSINDFRVRGSGAGSDTNAPLNSRGDFAVSAGPDAGANFTNGILISSVAENGRNNEGVTKFAVSMIENQRTNVNDPNALVGAYWINVNAVTNSGNNGGAGAPPEYNVNLAAAWFPYSQFIGGFARNHGPNDEFGQVDFGWTNGGALNQFVGSPGIALGSEFFDLGSGKSHLVLTNLGIDSRTDGILLVTGGKNESANFALAQVNTTNGGWNLFIKDEGQATTANFEQDPIAFVYIPRTNTSIISGRFLGNGAIATYSGASPQFTVTSNAAGTYELKIVGQAATNGVLIISPGGGETINADNLLNYQLNGTSDGWIIQSRDCPQAPLESPGATETVATFAFIPGPTPGFTVVPTNNLITTEAGGTAVFTVVLDKQPFADVTIPVSSSNAGEGTPSASSLTFTPSDWNTPQTITITGQDDAVQDGAVGYAIVLGATSSTDANYNGLDPADVSVVNADNEGGITVSPTSGLTTTELGGTTTFTLVLNTQPSAAVTIGLSSSDTTEGTVSPASVTFTSGDWNVPQTVTVTGVNDWVDDGSINYTIVTATATSGDLGYNGLNAPDVSVSNTDDDASGVVTSVGVNLVSLVEGKTNGYAVVLTSEPTANVTVNVSSGNTVQGGTVLPVALIFTPANWSNAQPVTATAADDLVVDGNTYWTNTLTFSSSDPLYAGLAPILISLQTIDNEGVLTLPSGDLIYGIGQAAIGIDGRATLTDPNSPNYNSGNLTVTLTANGTADDRLQVRNTGTGAGEIGVSGSTVSYGGIAIGSVAGGTGVAPLVITLNSTATPVATEALIRNVTFRNVSSTPAQNRRTVSFVLTDTDGGVTSASTGVRVGLLHFSDFQQGADHGYGIYSGEADIQLRQADPDTPYPAGSGGGLFIDYPLPGEFNAFHLLMRFDNIMGDGFGQIPSNAIVVAADLILRVPPEDPNSTGDGSPLYRMLLPWDETNSTWTSLGNGVDQDDIESRSTFDSQFGLVDGSGSTGTGSISFSVRPDIQAWQGAAANYGWAMPGWVGNGDGTTISPGEATNVFDRPRLRVLWLPADSASVTSLRQNLNDYTNAADTSLRANAPDTDRSTIQTLFPDWAVSGTSDNEQVLLKFGELVGTGTNQIPAGSRIHCAVLDVATVGGNAMGHGGAFHAMLQSWQDTNTWNYLVNGVSADDVEASSAISIAAGSPTLNPLVQGGFHSYEVTTDVQSWVDGALANNGWVVMPWTGGTDGWGFGSSETTVEINRPQLRVYYTAAPPSVVMLPPAVGASSVQINFNGAANEAYYVLRAPAVTGPWTTNGTATTSSNGSATYTDNAPLPGGAFYRAYHP